VIVAACVAVAIYLAAGAPHPLIIAPSLIAFGLDPFLGMIVAAALVGGTHLRRLAAGRAGVSDQRSEELLAADLVASGVEAGVSFDEAVSVASGFVSAPVAADLQGMARTAHRSRVTDDTDSVVAEMFRLSRRSADTGAPLASGLRSLSRAERAQDTAERMEELERLPVKLLFPLAFLILPGFLLVAVAPALVSGISKLSL